MNQIKPLFQQWKCKDKNNLYPNMHRGAEIKLNFTNKLHFKRNSSFMHHYLEWKFIPSAGSTRFKILNQELCTMKKQSIIFNALFKEKKMFNWVNEYGSSSGLTYCWLWNSTSTLIQAAQLVQWLASKDNTQAMAPENELQ